MLEFFKPNVKKTENKLDLADFSVSV